MHQYSILIHILGNWLITVLLIIVAVKTALIIYV